MRQKIDAHVDWVHFLLMAGPVALIGLGNSLPLFDPNRPGTDKFASGLTLAGSALSIGQIFFQSYKFDDVYVVAAAPLRAPRNFRRLMSAPQAQETTS